MPGASAPVTHTQGEAQTASPKETQVYLIRNHSSDERVSSNHPLKTPNES